MDVVQNFCQQIQGKGHWSVHTCCSVGMAALVAVTFQVELVVITFSSSMETPQNYICTETSPVIYFLREFYIHMIYKQLILI